MLGAGNNEGCEGMAYLEGVMNRVLLFMGTALLAIVSLAFPVQAGVMLTGAAPSTFSGPGETITFTYRLDEENITVNSMSLTGTNVPISGLTCTPAFPIDPLEVTNCTATYTTTASDVSDIQQYGGTYSLETIGGPRSGVVSSGAFVTYVPPTPQAIVTWDSAFVMAIGGPSGFLPNGGSVDIGTTVTFDFTFPTGWTYASLPSGCNIVHDSGDTWQGTITETCHVSGYETIILLHGIGSTELVEGEYGFFDIWTDGGVSPFTLTLDSGAVPTGMAFSNGHVSGIPSVTGSFEFTVGATNEYGHSASQAFTLTVVGSSTPTPTITDISPTTGPEAGGTTVTITGTNLTGATDVTFGGTAGTGIVVNSDTQITAVTPAGTAGAVDVAVATPAGTTTETGGFTYLADTLPALSISDVSKVETDSGGTPFLFNVQLDAPAPAGGVTFDVATADGTATAGDDYAVLSITGVTIGPGSFAAPITVQVFGDTIPEPDETFFVNITNVTNATIADGQGLGTIEDDDTASPTITGISPNNGPEAGGTTVTITGTNLTGANAVTFGGAAGTGIVVNSATSITATTPPGAAGAVDVVVTTPGGSATLTGGFTYTAATLPELSIDDVTVNEGDGNAVFTITLSAPAGPGGVTFTLATADGTAIAGDDYHSFNSSTNIPEGVDTYYHAVGLVDDAIEEVDETFFLDISSVVGATLAKARGTATIVDDDASIPPTITSISPDTGPAAGGTTVTITGTNLTGATGANAVTFGGVAATGYTVDSATQITAVTPAVSPMRLLLPILTW